MTEKLLTFLSPTPPLLPPDTLGMGSIGQKSTFFHSSINTNQQRHLYRDMCGSRIFLSGWGLQAPKLILQYTYRGGPMAFLHIFQGGGNFFRGGGGVQMLISIETHVTITQLDFPGDPLSPSGSAHGQCGILARICVASF